jgi:hypothetical protein
MKMAIDIGRVAYEAHQKVILNDWDTAEYYDEETGELLPSTRSEPTKWEDVPKLYQDAWRSAAVAVLKADELNRNIKL